MMRKHWFLAAFIAIFAVAAGVVSFRGIAAEKPTSMIVVIDGKDQGNRWLAHTYPNDQNDLGVPVLLVAEKDLELLPGQTVRVNGKLQGWKTSPRATVYVSTINKNIPQSFPNAVDSPPPAAGNVSRPPDPPNPYPPFNTGARVIFERKLAPNQWEARSTSNGEKVIVLLELNQQLQKVFDKRFANYDFTGKEWIIIGEDKGKDATGRVILVKHPDFLRDPNQP